MKKSIFSGGTLLLIAIFALAQCQPSQARQGESADSTCINISEPITLTEDTTICGDTTHTIDVDENDPAINIGAHDITITCEPGAIIDGVDNQGNGIYNDGFNNAEVTGCEVINYENGIAMTSFDNGAYIHHNFVHDNYGGGIQISGKVQEHAPNIRVEHNELIDNTLPEGGSHINVSWASEASISHNIMSSPTADLDKNHIGIHYDAAIGGEVNYNKGGILAIAIGTGGGSYGVHIAYNDIMGSARPDLSAVIGCYAHDNLIEYNFIHGGISATNWNEENYGVIFRNNILYNLSGKAAHMACYLPECPPDKPNVFTNNIVYNSGTGLELGINGVGKNNIIVGNETGIHAIEEGVIMHNDVWGNDEDYWSETTPAETDISADPLFVNPEDPYGPDGIMWTEDDGFRLQDGSPAIDAGDPQDDYSQEPDYPRGQINMGAYGNTTLATEGTACENPERGMIIEEDKTFCSGETAFDLGTWQTGLIVGASDITITCLDSIFIGSDQIAGFGLFNPGYDNVTITGCTFKNFNFGMIFKDSKNILLEDIQLTENKRGVYLVRGHNNEIKNSEITDNVFVDIAVFYGDLFIDWATASYEPIIKVFRGEVETEGSLPCEFFLEDIRYLSDQAKKEDLILVK